MPNEKQANPDLPASERMVPEIDRGAAFFYEHIVRYLFAAQFTKNKIVLDAGCGSGYGSFIIADSGQAKKVFAIDKSKETIILDREKYKNEKINFVQDDLEILSSVKDKSIDVVISFEVLEHLSNQQKFMDQIKRVLNDQGIFIVSTPNKKNYPPGNIFHKKELTLSQFNDLLNKYFHKVIMLSQSLSFAQHIDSKINTEELFLEESFYKKNITNFSLPVKLDNSQYFIAVCSFKETPRFSMTSLMNPSMDNFDLTNGIISLHSLEQQLAETEKKLMETTKILSEIQYELDYIKYSDYFKLWPAYENIKKLIYDLRRKITFSKYLNYQNKPYERWIKKNYPTKKILQIQKKIISNFRLRPLISIIIPIYDTPEKYLIECLESVLNQSYENFEICIADDASTKLSVKKIIKQYADKDKRIKYIFRPKNGHISEASNSALDLATGDYVGLLDHDDLLWPNALFEVVRAINKNIKAEFIYSDEDKLEEDGVTHSNPFFKPDWSPDYLRSINYITHFAVIKTQLISRVGGFRKGFEGAQDWDLFLRATSMINDKKNIVHIPTVLYSWRKSPLSTSSEKHGLSVKSYAFENQKKVLEADLQSRNYKGYVEATPGIGSWIIRYEIKDNPLVSIIIPTKDKFEYINNCLTSIIEKSTYKNFELIIVDTGSKDYQTINLYKYIKRKFSRIKILSWIKPFNFSSVCNFGAINAKGKYLIFLNNDTKLITPDWIERMLEHAKRPEVGAVGCTLLYPNQSIQHLGGILGISGSSDHSVTGIAGHAYRGIDYRNFRSFDSVAIKNYSFVTAACMMVEKKKFLSVGKFDEQFKIAFNDVDFCLRLYFNKGFFNLINPLVKFIHYESVSVDKPGSKNRDIKQFKKEIELFRKKWKKIINNDPFYNPNLSRTKEDFSINS